MMTTNKAAPIFISYSYDSAEHKQWVSKFATALRAKGIDALLDQWETDFGDNLALFMERGVRDSSRVLIICTEPYVRKADAGIGGVGYEGMIVTSELVKDTGTKKFIPVIRESSGQQVMPTFLGEARKYIDFRNDDEFDKNIEALFAALNTENGSVKPPLGKITTTLPQPLIELPKAIENAQEVYTTALALVRSGDMLQWRKLVQKLKASFKPGLIAWRKKYDANPPADYNIMREAVDEVVAYIAPPMAMAFAGIESHKKEFNDQRALFDEFYHLSDWERSGRTVLIELPTTLGFIYQALHGALCMQTGQAELAINFAYMRVGLRNDKKIPLWRHHGLMGWPESLGRDCFDVWKYISSAYRKWPWLHEIFGSEEEYKISLISYYILLNFMEFAQTLKEHPEILTNDKSAPMLDIPLCYVVENYNLHEKALSRLAKNSDIFIAVLQNWGVNKTQALDNWMNWSRACNAWLGSGGRYWSSGFPQEKLMDYLGW